MDAGWIRVHFKDGGFNAINLQCTKLIEYEPVSSITKERHEKITFRYLDGTSSVMTYATGLTFAQETRNVLNIGDQTKEDPAKK